MNGWKAVASLFTLIAFFRNQKFGILVRKNFMKELERTGVNVHFEHIFDKTSGAKSKVLTAS